MTPTFRAFLPVGGRIARRIARRLFLSYGIRPRVIARALSLADRLFPLWRVDALPAGLPVELHLQALLDTAAREADDRPAVLYLCAERSLLLHRDLLERTFILRHADGTALADPQCEKKEVRQQ